MSELANYPELDGYEFHPVAMCYPLMSERELKRLQASVEKIGQREAIKRDKGKILTGRNVLIVCKRAGIEPRIEEYEGGNPIAEIIASNSCRRHMSKSQKAYVAARLANLPKGRPPKIGTNADFLMTQQQAARQIGVSVRMVGKAVYVRENDPELFEAVGLGELTIADAVRRVETQKMVQEAERQRKLQEEERQRKLREELEAPGEKESEEEAPEEDESDRPPEEPGEEELKEEPEDVEETENDEPKEEEEKEEGEPEEEEPEPEPEVEEPEEEPEEEGYDYAKALIDNWDEAPPDLRDVFLFERFNEVEARVRRIKALIGADREGLGEFLPRASGPRSITEGRRSYGQRTT